jgi:hypothetical protein
MLSMLRCLRSSRSDKDCADWDAPGAVPQLPPANDGPALVPSSSANDAVTDAEAETVKPQQTEHDHAAGRHEPTPLREVSGPSRFLVLKTGVSSVRTLTSVGTRFADCI